MRGFTVFLICVVFSLLSNVRGKTRDGRPHGNYAPHRGPPLIAHEQQPVTSRNGTALPAYTKVYQFLQLKDHGNPSLGTFHQRYWFTYEFYEPGGPIVLMTPGEVAADGT